MSPIRLNRLGWYDDGGDGLTRNHTVVVWDYDTGDVVVEAVVTKGVTSELLDGWRQVEIPEVTLPPFHTWLVGERYVASEPTNFLLDPVKVVRQGLTLVPTDPQIAGVVLGCQPESAGMVRALCFLADSAIIGPMAFALPGGVRGDFNYNGSLDAMDIDWISAIARNEIVPQLMDERIVDINRDGRVNGIDRTIWIKDVRKSYLGDSDFDGEFNSTDLVSVFGEGQYEDAIAANTGWAGGDWNGDGEFDTSDLVAAFEDGGYEQGPRQAAVVPEAVSLTQLSMLGLLWCGRRRRWLAGPSSSDVIKANRHRPT